MPVKAPVQDAKQIGITTVTIGSGIAMLSLPDVGSMVVRGANIAPTFPVFETFKFSDNFDNRVGWNINGSIAVPVGGATVSLNGFWARIKGNDSFTCTVQAGNLCQVMPLVDNPAIQQINAANTFGSTVVANSERKVDHWGAALESKWALNPGFLQGHYWAAGADIRGIYQNLDSTITSNDPAWPFVATYGENLNTTYSGAYLAWGGNLSPILLNSWGIETAFRLQGGIYYAHTNYDGQLTNSGAIIGGGGDPSGALTLSHDNAAFIGGATLEARKRITKRAMLSLKGEYEYYSYVPQMIYNTANLGPNPQRGPDRQFGTFIENSHASSLRASLRLTIGLGPDELYK